MHHIVSIKTIVAKLVKQEFVSRKIRDMFGKRSLQLIDGKQKRGFAQLIDMHSIAYVSYRADGKNHFQLRVPGNQTGEKGSIVG